MSFITLMSIPAVYSCQGHSPERVWVGNDGFNDVVWAMGIISARIAELTHAGCRELPLTARQTPREEAEELASGGLFFTAKRMHDTVRFDSAVCWGPRKDCWPQMCCEVFHI